MSERDVLEQNVSTLIEKGGEAPRMADAARARIRAELVTTFGAPQVARTMLRVPLRAIAIGVAAMAMLVLVISRWIGGGATPAAQDGALADGSTFITAPGGKVAVLGRRHVRVDGAALLDVAPGQGTFTVETARGTIEVLGTRFYVDGEAERTTAAVVRGEVRLASSAGSVVLHAGEQGVAEAGRAPTRGPAPRLSQLVSWAREARRRAEKDAPTVHHGTLFARDPGVRSHPPWGEEYPLPLKNLGVDIVVEDQVARVAIDQTFHNDQNQDLEGVYRFAIPPDAALQRLAMYVDGHLEESAVVERMQARRIYEELVYRRVDPALLEWAGTGRVNLRIYPIPALEDKRLVLAYTQSLPKLYDDWTLTVPLPDVDEPVGDLAVKMRVKGCASCEISSTSHQVQVARDGDDAIVTFAQHAAKLGDSFVLHVRDPRHATTVATHTADGEHYLLVRAPVSIPHTAREYRPRTWVLLDDVSASRGALELRAQQDLIDAFLRELDEDDRVAVVAFDVQARVKLAPTRVRDVDRRAVRAALKAEGGVGATDFSIGLGAAESLLNGVAAQDASIVYLGDGVITAGPRELDKLRADLVGKAQFVGVGVGDGPDTQTLDALAAATGGYATTMDLSDDLGWRAFDLVAALHTARVTGVTARLVDAHGAAVPATAYAPAQLADGEELELVAKVESGQPAAVELAGAGGWKQTIALPASTHDGGYLPRLWAQRHIAARLLAKHEAIADDQREARDEAIRKEVVALGKKYFLLSRHTSLLVLENDEMYARYGVQKGAGDTWAPYALPAKIPVVRTAAASLPAVDDRAELVRAPLQLFWDQSAYYDGVDRDQWGGPIALGTLGALDGRIGGGGGSFGGITLATRSELGIAENETRRTAPVTVETAGAREHAEADANEQAADAQQIVIGGDELQGHIAATTGWGSGYGKSGTHKWRGYLGPVSLVRLASPGDGAFDDLTAFVPAFVVDDADALRKELGAPATHAIEPAARALLADARRALPAGIYHWGDFELAVDDARRIGWRRTTADGLDEHAWLDGGTWQRHYPELRLVATRTIGGDDIAIALAYLPIWIAEPEHYARWFDVTAHGREVTLAKHGKAMFVLAFDDRAHLIAVRDARGATLVDVTWSANGPTAAHVRGDAIDVGYTATTVTDAAAWARGGAGFDRAPIEIQLPLHPATFWTKRREGFAAGSAEWCGATRQMMASYAIANARNDLYRTYQDMHACGAQVGDLALASSGLTTVPTDTELAKLLAPYGSEALARYFLASRAYGRGERPAVASRTGFIGALWSLRAVSADLATARSKDAADNVAAIDPRAPKLRFAAASHARVTSAIGPYKNVARAQAALALANRGDYNGAAEMIAKLVDELDLRALPARYDQAPWLFQSSRRGPAGWQLLWATWRDKVLAGGSFAHVMALVPMAAQHPGDSARLLARAAELAGGDVERTLEVARTASATGQAAWARQLLEPLLKAAPSRELYQELAQLQLGAGDVAGALASLEAAQDAGADERVDIATVRGELAQIIALAQRLALQSTGAEREHAIARALSWGQRWRAVDPGNSQIDQQLGDVLLSVGDRDGAWRQLSGAIERDPWSGSGYMTVADAFERQGKIDTALGFWQQAIVIDQTNPTPRLRKAQALIALGRTADGDALLDEIASHKWHDMWSGVVYQAQELRARGKATR